MRPGPVSNSRPATERRKSLPQRLAASSSPTFGQETSGSRKGVVRDKGDWQLGTAPSRRWACLIAWTFEHGHKAVCGGGIVGDLLDDLELEPVVEVVQSRA